MGKDINKKAFGINPLAFCLYLFFCYIIVFIERRSTT